MSDIRAIVDDILALHAEEDEIKISRRAHYADAQEAGYDKAALGLAIRTIRSRRKQETPASLEKQSKADQYVEQYDASHVRVGAREGQPSGAGTGSTVRTSAPIREDA